MSLYFFFPSVNHVLKKNKQKQNKNKQTKKISSTIKLLLGQKLVYRESTSVTSMHEKQQSP